MRRAFFTAVALFSLTVLLGCAPALSVPLPTGTAKDSEIATATPTDSRAPSQVASAAAWIEVDLARQAVVLHQGGGIVAEFPASTGVTTDEDYATPPGLYRVQSKEKGPIESVPRVYVSDVVMFDWGKGNAFHSRPADANGNLLDPRLGQPLTAGCVRVGESARLFEFAKIDMRVWIH